MKVAESVIDILADITGSDEIRMDPTVRLFEECVLDSLQTVELIIRVSQAFEIEISPSEFDRTAWATPTDIAADVRRRLETRAP